MSEKGNSQGINWTFKCSDFNFIGPLGCSSASMQICKTLCPLWSVYIVVLFYLINEVHGKWNRIPTISLKPSLCQAQIMHHQDHCNTMYNDTTCPDGGDCPSEILSHPLILVLACKGIWSSLELGLYLVGVFCQASTLRTCTSYIVHTPFWIRI